MDKAQNIFGNLALKPVAAHTKSNLRVIDSTHEERSLCGQVTDQLFSSQAQRPYGNEQTAQAFSFYGRPILKTKEERRFAYIACAIAAVTVFYFSFFAFV